ncbi:helix-turn-helix domain-containing protein [Gluconacetobacter diazotrophicus]|uniref:Helix-turn-helix domain-containing protein n=1 Tax=Gluconacetobacter diazotrophicus TaxID=33996 RepID=A0A7W4NG05_GLUDI|nr:helix-turn-helix domain-containing protein [Gluconacetobacter diazotrophicus]
MANSSLQSAVDLFGGQSSLAKAIGKKQGHVWWWLHRARKVPAEQAIAIERATGGAVSRQDLRPDLFGIPAPPVEAPAPTTPEAAG